MARRIRITVAYDGTDFHGWQVQLGLPTIQGILEQVVASIEKKPVHVAGSGRTDAGVHALEQVAAFTLDNPIPINNLRFAMNRLLPPTIRVCTVTEADPDFHPRFDATAKTYRYVIFREEICPPFEWRYVHYHPFPLDERSMTEIAPLLRGEHDFTAFSAKDVRDEEGKSKVRTIFSSELVRQGARLTYTVRGSGFLKHMVRNLVGAIIEAGKGNLTPAGLQAMLQPGALGKAGPTVPAKGLTLLSVEYGGLPDICIPGGNPMLP